MRGRHGGISVEVAVESPAPRRARQRVVRPNELVETDPLVSRRREPFDREAEQVEPLGRIRQPVPLQGLLVRPQRGHVGIPEARNPLRGELHDFLDRPAEAVGRLLREPIDEIDVDALEPGVPGRPHRTTNLLHRLHAPDGALDIGVEILDAEAHPAEPQ